eukprot:13366-Heterococcus_DN1.PRE.10
MKQASRLKSAFGGSSGAASHAAAPVQAPPSPPVSKRRQLIIQVDEGDDGFTSDGGNSPSHSKQAWELIKQASPSALLQRLSPRQSSPQQQQLQLQQQQQSLSIVSPVPRDGAIECPVTEPQAVAQAPGGRRNSLARRVFDSTLPARHRSKAS